MQRAPAFIFASAREAIVAEEWVSAHDRYGRNRP
jgi:hypothetical protein